MAKRTQEAPSSQGTQTPALTPEMRMSNHVVSLNSIIASVRSLRTKICRLELPRGADSALMDDCTAMIRKAEQELENVELRIQGKEPEHHEAATIRHEGSAGSDPLSA